MSALRISGELMEDARNQCDVRGHYSLALQVQLPHDGPGSAVVVRALKPYGTGAAAGLACASRARQLRRGVRVVVSADVIRRIRGRLHVDRIEDVQAPDLTINMRGSDS